MINHHSKLEKTLDGAHVSDILSALTEGGSGIHGKLFRGHADCSWKLIPSLYRNDVSYDRTVYRDGSIPRHYAESDRTEAFFHSRFFHKAQPHGITPSGNMLYDLCMLQHYGVATRLLDWSRDPLVALFFAVESCTKVDAAIYAVGTTGFLPYELLTCELAEVGKIDKIMKFETPLFDGRVSAQKSIFTLQPFETEAGEYLSLDDRDLIQWDEMEAGRWQSKGQLESFTKIIIPWEMKYNLLAELISFGIDRSTLFPGLQGIGDSIMNGHKLGLSATSRI